MEDLAGVDIAFHQFAEAFYKNRRKYLNYALRFVHNPAAVEDLVDDSFAKFWEKRKSIPQDTIIESYFYTIIKNRCLNWLRDQESQYKIQNKIFNDSQRLRQYDIAVLENFDPNLIFTSEIERILREQLAKMPERTRQIFIDNRFNDLSYEEIAKKYDMPFWKVKKEIWSTTSMLRVSLQDYLPAALLPLICSVYLKNLP